MLDKIAVAAAVGAVVSLLLEVVPGLAEAWDQLNSKAKRGAVLLLSLGLPLIAVAAKCFGLDVGLGGACPSSIQDVYDALFVGFAAFGGSQWSFVLAGQDLRSHRVVSAYFDENPDEDDPDAG